MKPNVHYVALMTASMAAMNAPLYQAIAAYNL